MINKHVFTPVVSCRANPIVEEKDQDAGHVKEAVLKMATSAEPEVQIGNLATKISFIVLLHV